MKKIIPNISILICKEALAYYKAVFGGEIRNVQMAEGKEMFKGHEGKVVHAELHVNSECVLYFNDLFEDKGTDNNISLILTMDSKEEAERIYAAIKENGKVTFELQKTFWGSLHGVVTDRYGVTWNVDYAGK